MKLVVLALIIAIAFSKAGDPEQGSRGSMTVTLFDYSNSGTDTAADNTVE